MGLSFFYCRNKRNIKKNSIKLGGEKSSLGFFMVFVVCQKLHDMRKTTDCLQMEVPTKIILGKGGYR